MINCSAEIKQKCNLLCDAVYSIGAKDAAVMHVRDIVWGNISSDCVYGLLIKGRSCSLRQQIMSFTRRSHYSVIRQIINIYVIIRNQTFSFLFYFLLYSDQK